MSYADGRYWITYNGELYNFREFERELEREGMRFTTATDTEVLLAMYARYGSDMLPRLNGMFAFAVWDAEAQELFLARDRLGIKPLYWAQHNGALYFASEVKGAVAGAAASAHAHGAGPGLSDLPVGARRRHPLRGNLQARSPATAPRSAIAELSIGQWWDMTFAPEERDEHEWADMRPGSRRQRRQATDGVGRSAWQLSQWRNRLKRDRRVHEPGGRTGHDLHSRLQPGRPRHDIVPDDLRYARLDRAAVRRLTTTRRCSKPKIVDLLPKLIWHMDEPIADPAASRPT